jgi:uncharacterized protein (DUF2235 family)
VRRLAVFADGTWNVPRNNTNVWRLNQLLDISAGQLGFYHRGIGTSRTNRLRGAFGKGVNANIRNCYEWLVRNYSTGDHIYIFGFSRGAYIARSLAGFIERCGLLLPGSPLSVVDAFERYRTTVRNGQRLLNRPDAPEADWPIRQDKALQRYSRSVEVHFLGVWDTVRYHDVPFGSVRGVSRSENLFHVIQPTRNTRNVYHALAVDEHRRAYAHEVFLPPPSSGCKIEERWFSGAHSNVGGGYRNDTLARIPLLWMQQSASRHGLQFKRPIRMYGDEHRGDLTDSFAEFLGGAYRLLPSSERYIRPIVAAGRLTGGGGTQSAGLRQTIDASVFDRWRDVSSYRPCNISDWAESRGVDPLVCQGDQVI